MKNWHRHFGSGTLALLLAIPMLSAAPPSSTGTSQPPNNTADTTPPDTAEADSTQPDSMPGVKKGSEADVNAIGNRKVGRGPDFYSLEREIALGKSLASQVDKSAKFINDPVVTEYVNRIGQNIVRNSDAQVPFTIKVIDSSEVNAFALPGGFFYVNSGLLLRADEEAEVAGVMAHEIAHVCARHGTRNATKGELAQLATIPLIMFGPVGWAGYGLYEGLNFALPLTFLQFSRSAEAEADYLGLQYMWKAGYDPNAFVAFFEKIEADEKKHPGTIPKIFSTHPPTPERIEAAQKEIATILPPRDEYIVDTSEFDSVKARLAGIERGEHVQESSKDKGGRPTLRKRTDPNPSGSGGTSTDSGSGNGNGTDQSSGDDSDRPTLKRRPEDDSQN
jgi:beta-barrel assembly-enhancing protease